MEGAAFGSGVLLKAQVLSSHLGATGAVERLGGRTEVTGVYL